MSNPQYNTTPVEAQYRLLVHLTHATERGEGEALGHCPIHNDESESLSIAIGRTGKVVWHCHAGCSKDALTDAMHKLLNSNAPLPPAPKIKKAKVKTFTQQHLPQGKGITHHIFTDVAGTPLCAEVRTEPGANGRSKDIRQWSKTKDGWASRGMRGKTPLWNLPGLAKHKGLVMVVEGPKCAIFAQRAFAHRDVLVTTWVSGVGNINRADFAPLNRCDVILVADDDTAGRKAVREVAAKFAPASLRLYEHLGNTKRDVVDWIEERGADAVWNDIMRDAKPLDEVDPEPDVLVESKDRAALQAALKKLNIGIRYNVLTERTEISIDGGVWQRIDDRLESKIQEDVAVVGKVQGEGSKTHPLYFPDTRWKRARKALEYEHSANPFLEWIELLPTWDGTSRLDGLVHKHFDIDGDERVMKPLIEWVSRFLIMGIIVRQYTPGYPLDVMPVFIGAQGIGKSRFVRALLPSTMQSYFGDTLNLSANAQRQLEATQGKVLIEGAEMLGSNEGANAMKAALTRTNDDGIRKAYAHNPEDRPRRYIVVGTSNDEMCLPSDPSGNRRFLAFLVKAKRNVKAMLAEMDAERLSLWAEGKHRVHAGEEVFLPYELEHHQRKVNEKFRYIAHPSREMALETAINSLMDYPESQRDGIHIHGILEEAGYIDNEAKARPDIIKELEQHARRVLVRLGFRSGPVQRFSWGGKSVRARRYNR